MKNKSLYPKIVYAARTENSYYHTKMLFISFEVMDQWCKQNDFSVISCFQNGRVIFGKCKKGFSVLFKDTRKDFYLCHFARHISDEFVELFQPY